MLCGSLLALQGLPRQSSQLLVEKWAITPRSFLLTGEGTQRVLRSPPQRARSSSAAVSDNPIKISDFSCDNEDASFRHIQRMEASILSGGRPDLTPPLSGLLSIRGFWRESRENSRKSAFCPVPQARSCGLKENTAAITAYGSIRGLFSNVRPDHEPVRRVPRRLEGDLPVHLLSQSYGWLQTFRHPSLSAGRRRACSVTAASVGMMRAPSGAFGDMPNVRSHPPHSHVRLAAQCVSTRHFSSRSALSRWVSTCGKGSMEDAFFHETVLRCTARGSTVSGRCVLNHNDISHYLRDDMTSGQKGVLPGVPGGHNIGVQPWGHHAEPTIPSVPFSSSIHMREVGQRWFILDPVTSIRAFHSVGGNVTSDTDVLRVPGLRWQEGDLFPNMIVPPGGTMPLVPPGGAALPLLLRWRPRKSYKKRTMGLPSTKARRRWAQMRR